MGLDDHDAAIAFEPCALAASAIERQLGHEPRRVTAIGREDRLHVLEACEILDIGVVAIANLRARVSADGEGVQEGGS